MIFSKKNRKRCTEKFLISVELKQRQTRPDVQGPAKQIGDGCKNWAAAEKKVYSLEPAEDENTGSDTTGERPK